MKILSLFAAATGALWLVGCEFDVGEKGSGHIVTTQRPIEAFSEIEGRGGFRIEWKSGPPSLSVTTDDNLVDLFEARNVGDRLVIKMRERVRPTHGIKVTLSSASLTAAKLSGATDLLAHGVTGSSFAVQTTGAASLVLDGTVDHLLADLTGASDLKAKNLQAKVVEVSTTGAANAWVNASQKLRVAVTGAGDVTYSGNPATIEKKVTGAGTIHHKD